MVGVAPLGFGALLAVAAAVDGLSEKFGLIVFSEVIAEILSVGY